MISEISQSAQTPPRTDAPSVSIGEGSFFAFATAVIFFLLNKGWEYLQSRTQREDRRSESELTATERIIQKSVENKDKLLEQIQNNQRILLEEVLDQNDEAIKTIQANLVTVLGIQSATNDNLKYYSEVINQKLDRLIEALNRVDVSTSRSVAEAFSTQARLYADLKQNQFLMTNKIDKLHFRFDKQFGNDQDV